MADNTTDLSPWLQSLLGQMNSQPTANSPSSPQPYNDQQISGFTPQNTVGIDPQDLQDAIEAHSQTPEAKKSGSFKDHLGGFLKNFARGLLSGVNPEAYQQMQENQRQQQLFAQQQFNRNNPSPYEQAQIDQMKSASGMDIWKILSGGGHVAGPDEQPDFSVGGKGFVVPPQEPEKTYTIAANSDLGKRLGLPEDITGITQDQYIKTVLPQLEHIHTEADDAAQAKLMNSQIDSLVSAGKDTAAKRYGQSQDPLSQNNLTLFNQALDAAALEAKSTGKMAPVTSLLHNMNEPTQWEKMADKAEEYRQQLRIKAAEAGAKGDPHLMQAINSQSRAIDEIAKPLQKEWEDGENIRTLAQMKTPAADAQLIVAMQPYITGLKRFSDTELKSIRNGATVWTNIQKNLNKYSADPYHAQIPDDQRNQLVQMLTAKQANLKGQLDKINDTRDDIAGMTQASDVLRRSAKLHRDLATPSTPTTAIEAGEPDFIVQGGKVVRNPNKK